MQALPEDVLRGQLRREFPQAQEEDITAAIDRSGGFLGQAMSLLSGGGELPQQTRDFVQAFSARDALGLMQTLTPMESGSGTRWRTFWKAGGSCWKAPLPAEAASGRCRPVRNSPEPQQPGAAERRAVPAKAVDYTTGNVSPAAVCGWLEWALR